VLELAALGRDAATPADSAAPTRWIQQPQQPEQPETALAPTSASVGRATQRRCFDMERALNKLEKAGADTGGQGEHETASAHRQPDGTWHATRRMAGTSPSCSSSGLSSGPPQAWLPRCSTATPTGRTSG